MVNWLLFNPGIVRQNWYVWNQGALSHDNNKRCTSTQSIITNDFHYYAINYITASGNHNNQSKILIIDRVWAFHLYVFEKT